MESKKKINLSLICFFNKKEQLDEYLLKSYEKQNVCCELVLIDNTTGKFSSAVDAINYGIDKSTCNNIIILHQDIVFLDKDTLKSIYERIENSNNEIIGVAGTCFDEKKVYTSLVHGSKKEQAGANVLKFNEEKEVFVLDECLFGFKKNILNKIKFDNVTCDNWHFYAVDFCYQAKLNGIKVISYGANIWHASYGNKNHAFYVSLKKIQNKYKNDFSKIISCCIDMPINDSVLKYELKEKYRVWRCKTGPRVKKMLGLKKD